MDNKKIDKYLEKHVHVKYKHCPDEEDVFEASGILHKGYTPPFDRLGGGRDLEYEDGNNEEVFDSFKKLSSAEFDKAIKKTKADLEEISDENDVKSMSKLALNLAITANAYITIAKRIIYYNKKYVDMKEIRAELENEKTKKEGQILKVRNITKDSWSFYIISYQMDFILKINFKDKICHYIMRKHSFLDNKRYNNS